MEWIKRVMIVFDTHEKAEFLGNHNGKYQAVELRLRSDGKMYYMGKHSKILPPKTVELMDKQREDRWNEFLSHSPDTPSVTPDEFLAESEAHRVKINGAYL